MHYLLIFFAGFAGVTLGAGAKNQTASVLAAGTGKNVLDAVNSDIAAQAKDPSLADALTKSNDAFVAAGQAAVGDAKPIRSLADTGAANNASSVQSAANDLSLQTVEVDKSLLTIANPKSTPDQVKAAALQALADELAEGDERSTLAGGSSDQTTANNFVNQVNQLGPSVVLNGFTQIAQGQGDPMQLAFAITNAREQVIVPANCALIQSGSGTNLCASRKAIDPTIFGVSSATANENVGQNEKSQNEKSQNEKSQNGKSQSGKSQNGNNGQSQKRRLAAQH